MPIIGRHVIPVVLPTLLTLATLEFCYVMLAESSLSFLGIGIQPPDVSWGLMVAQGRQYLQTAWWLSIFPGARHRHHHRRREHAGRLAADRHRPGPALAPQPSPQEALIARIPVKEAQ